MAEEIENLVARITFDGTQFQKGAAAINRQIKVLQSEFQAAAAKFTDFGKSTDSLKLKSDSLTKQIELQKKRIDALRSSLQQTIEKKGEDSKASQNLAIQINNAKEKLAQMENELKKTNDQLKKQSSGWNQFQQKLGSAGEKMKSIGDKMKDVGESMTKKVTAPIVGVGFAATKAAIDFESAFAGVRKTVNATEDEYRQLEKGIRDMAKQIPSSAEEIAHVAETAGQLGIQKKNILSFTRTMIDLGNSTNLSADEAATALARLANITQMPQNQFRRLGSAIVALGNNMATTESEIAEMALRIAGAGHQVGMTQSQILGFAAALSSVGINAEAGGSAISRVMITMANAVKNGGKALDEFAQVAGMSSSQFAKSFEKDAAGSIIRFIEGLAKVKESGGNVFQVLKDLGLSEIEVRDALLRASGAGDLFRRSLQLSTKAWKDNNALTREATQRYKTTESQLKIFWNRIKDVGISLGQALIPALLDAIDASKPFIDWLKRMADGFTKLDKPTQRIILAFSGVTAAIGPFLAMVGPLVAGIGSLAVAFSAAEISIGAVLGPLGLLIGAMTAAGIGIAKLSQYQRRYADDSEHFRQVNFKTAESLQKQHDANEKLIEEFDRLRNKSSLTTEEFGRYLDLQDQLKETSDPEAIKSIKDQMEQLRKKSGLSNDQLQRMVDLNDRLTDKLPGATGAITDMGNKVAGTTDKLKDFNAEMAKAATMDLELQYQNAYNNAIKAISKKKELQDKLNIGVREERDLLNLVGNYNKQDVQAMIKKYEQSVEQAKIMLRSNTLRGEERATVVEVLKHDEAILKALRGGKDALLDQVNVLDEQNKKTKAQIAHQNEIISKYDIGRKKLELQYLTEAGISENVARQNIEKGTEIDLIDLTIAKLKSKLKTIEKETPPNQKNTDEYRRQVSAIKSQISNLESVRSKVIDIKEDAQSLNKALGKSISKKIDMKVDIDWSKIPPQQRRFVIGQVNAWRLQGYAKGTDYAPGGWAIVGEEGPELVNLPRGAQVIPADKTRRLLSGSFSQASQWGRNLITMLTDGVKSKYQTLVNAVNSVAIAIEDYLGWHSPTRKGPGKSSDKWIPNLIKMLAAGLYSGQGTIGKAASSAVDPITKSIQSMIKKSTSQLSKWENATKSALRRLEHAHSSHTKRVAQAQASHYRELTSKSKSTISDLQHEQSIWNTYLKSVQSAQATYQKNVKAVQDKLKSDTQAALKEYQDQVAQTTQSIANFAGGMFGEVSRKNVDPSKLYENLFNQINVLKQYNADIQALSKRGVGKDFLQQLMDMGPQAADEIHALTRMTDFQLKQYVNMWKQEIGLANNAAVLELDPLKKETEQKIKDLQTAAKKQMSSYYKTLQDSLKKAATTASQQLTKLAQTAKTKGESAVVSLANSIKSKLPKLNSTAQTWGKNIINSIAKGMTSASKAVENAAKSVAQHISDYLGFHSPSKKGPGSDSDKWMPNLMRMLTEGVQKYTPALKSALSTAIDTPNFALNAKLPSTLARPLAASGVTAEYNFIQPEAIAAAVAQAIGPIISNQSSMSQGTPQKVVVQIGGYEATGFIKYVTQEQSRLQSIQNRFKGR